MQGDKLCKIHEKKLTLMCLAVDCKENFFLCSECQSSGSHKHSKTDLVQIQEIQKKVKASWQPKQSLIQPYFKKVNQFYEALRKDINKLIDEDQNAVEVFLTKVKYHHLPIQANSQVYLQLIKEQYERLDRGSMLKLINEVQNGDLNKNLDKQKQIAKFLDFELKKVNEKILTLKYVMLSKKLQSQLLAPSLPQPSKICDQHDFVKIYSLFNARKLLVRSIKLVYRASESKFSAKDYYTRCNESSNCLVLVKTKNKKIVGGYTPQSLVHHQQDTMQQDGQIYESDKSKRSFIFSVSNLKSYSIKDDSKAILYKKNAIGPSFGVDLSVNKFVTSSMGNSYEGIQGVGIDSLQSKIMLLETDKAELQQMEIWQMSF